MNDYLLKAVEEARIGVENQDGGPFGAVVVLNGKIVGVGHNQVLISNDPTAHAEVMAIRDACKNLHTHDLSDCIIYSTSEPCPMCLSAIIWSNIKEVYFEDNQKDLLNVKEIKSSECQHLLDDYQNEIY